MKVLAMILAVMLLASCAGMGETSGAGMREGASNSGPSNQMNINRHDNPSDIYFGG